MTETPRIKPVTRHEVRYFFRVVVLVGLVLLQLRQGNHLLAFTVDRLAPGQNLVFGTPLRSPNGRFRLLVTTNSLVLADRNAYLWEPEPYVFGLIDPYLQMRTDGNLVLYSGDHVAHWSSQTFVANSSLVLQNDGNLVIYDPTGVPVWQTSTFEGQTITWWPHIGSFGLDLFTHENRFYWIGANRHVNREGDSNLAPSWVEIPNSGPSMPVTNRGASSGVNLCLPGISAIFQLYTMCTSNAEAPSSTWTGPHLVGTGFSNRAGQLTYFKGKFVMVWTTNDITRRLVYSVSDDGKTWADYRPIGVEAATNHAENFTFSSDTNQMCIIWLVASASSFVTFSCTDSISNTAIWSDPIAINAPKPNDNLLGPLSASWGDRILVAWIRLDPDYGHENMQFAIIKRGAVVDTPWTLWWDNTINGYQSQFVTFSDMVASRDQMCLTGIGAGTDLVPSYTYCRPIVPNISQVFLPLVRR